MRKAIVLIGHGSRVPGFARPMQRLARALKKEQRGSAQVLCAYLEITRPSIPEAVAVCVRQGAREIKLLPYFLLEGAHVERDIPRIASAARRKHRARARIVLCPYLGYHEKILAVVKQRLKERVS